MANYGHVPRGYSPISSFKENLYAELEKPISTQNLEQYLAKFDKVIAEITRAKQGLEKDLASGKSVGNSTLSAIIKEGKEATEVFNHLEKKIAEFSKFDNAKKNFPEQFKNLYNIRNASDTVRTSAKLSQMAVQKQAQQPQNPSAGKTIKSGASKDDALKAKADEAKKDSDSIVQSAQKANEAIVNVGNEQPKGEVLPAKQVEAQLEGMKQQAQKTASEIKETIGSAVNTSLDKNGYTREQAIAKGEVYSLADAIKQKQEELDALMKKASESPADKSIHDAKVNALGELQKLIKEREDIKKDIAQSASTASKTEPSKKPEGLSNAEKRIKQAKEGNYNYPVDPNTGKVLDTKLMHTNNDQVQSYDQLNDKIKELVQQANTLRATLQQTPVSGQAYQKTVEELSAVEAKLKELQKTKALIDKQSAEAKPAPPIEPFKADPKNYKEIVAWIDTLKSKMAGMNTNARNGQLLTEADFQAYKEYESELKRLEALKKRIDSGQSAGQGVVNEKDATKIHGILGLLKETLATKSQLARENANIFSSQDMESTQAHINALTQRLGALKQMWKTASDNSILVNSFHTIGTAVKGFGSAVGSATVGLFNLAKGGFNAVKNGISAVKSGFQTLKSHMQALVKKTTPNLMKSFGSLKSMLMRRIKRTFISAIFNQAKEGLQQLAKSSDAFNQSMSNIKNSAKEVAGNLAISLGNLIQAIEPALQTILGFINSILQAINGLFAMLSGKTTMMVAKKGTDDYAKSLKGASGAAKDLNHQLYGFDELTRQEDNNGGGGGGSKIGYEEQEIGEAIGGINDFFKEMLQAFQNGEFEKVGSLVADKLNDVVNSIDKFVKELAPKAKEWATNIARILNGFFDTFDFTRFGELIGDATNAVTGAINNFFATFDVKKLGIKLADIFNGLVNSINFEELGKTIANIMSFVPRYVFGFLTSLDYKKLGKAIGKGLQSFINNFDFEAIVGAIIAGFNGITDLLIQVVTNVKWADVAKRLLNGLKKIFTDIKWSNLTNLFKTCLKEVFNVGKELVTTDTWNTIAETITQTLVDLIESIDFAELGTLLGKGIQTIFDIELTILKTLSQVDWGSIAGNLAQGINNLFASVDWAQVASNLSSSLIDLIKGLGHGIAEFIKQIDWQALINDIISFVTNVDWAGLFSAFYEVCGELVSSIISALSDIGEAIWGAIEGAWNEVVTWWNERMEANGGDVIRTLLDAIVTAVSGIATFVYDNVIHPFVSGLESALGLEEGTIGEVASNLWEDFKTGVLSAWGTLKDFVTNVWDGFSEWISSSWDDISVNVSQFFEGVWSGIVGAFGTVKDFATNIWTGFTDWISETWAGISTDVSTFFSGIWEGIVGAFGTLGDTATNLWDGFLSGVTSAWESISSSVVGVFTGAWDAIKDAFSGVADFCTNLWDGIKNGLSTAWTSLKESILKPFKDMWKAVLDFFGIHSPSTEANSVGQNILQGLLGGFLEIVDSIVESVKAVFKKIWDAILSIFGIGAGESEEKKDGKQAGKDIMTGIKDGMTGESEPTKKAARTAAKDILNAMKGELGIPEQGGASSKTKEFAGSLLNGISEGIQERSTEGQFVSAMNKAFSSVESGFKKAFDVKGGGWFAESYSDKFKSMGESIVNGLKKGVEENADKFDGGASVIAEKVTSVAFSTEKGKAIVQSIIDGMTSALNNDITVNESAESFAKNIQSTLETTLSSSNGEKVIKDLITSIGDAFSSDDTVISDNGKASTFAKSIISAIKDVLVDEDGKAIGDAFAKAIGSGISDAYSASVSGNVSDFAYNIIDTATDMLSDYSGALIGYAFANGISYGVEQEYGNAIKTINDFAVNVVNHADRTMSEQNGRTIGSNMIIGMINGLNAYGQMLVDTIAHICNVSAETARLILGIASPSKVFAEIGEYTMQGMQIGLKESGEDAINTVADVTNAIVKEAESGEGIKIQTNAMVDGLDVVAGKMSRLAEIFSDIADTITQMGGLEIPAVASGKVLPYRSQIGNQSVGNVSLTGSNDLEDAIYSAFSRAIGTASNNEQAVEITLQIDGRKLTDIVTKYQRQQSRAWSV